MADPFNDQNQGQEEDLSTGLKVLSFCIPLAGIILYFTNKSEYPKKSKSACTFALIGIGFGLIIQVIFTVLGLGAGAY